MLKLAGLLVSLVACSALQGPVRAPLSVRRSTTRPIMRSECGSFLSRGGNLKCASKEELEAEIKDSEAASADGGPNVLMPPVETLDVMPADATTFAGYLAPYAVLVLAAFAFASGAFALLVLKG